jgi:uncharacterized protein YggE
MKQALRSTILFLGILLSAFLLAGCGSLAGSGDPSIPTISVTGYGEAAGTPDSARIQLGVNVVDSDVGRAVEEANTTTDAVRAAVLALGVAERDVLTTNYNVWPEDRYDPQTGIPTGERVYRVESTLQIKTTDISGMGDLITAALDAGANNIFGISFGLDETAALAAQARELAVADAEARAQQLTAELGLTLGEPLYISEGAVAGPYGPVYSLAEAGYGLGGGGGGAPINSGQATVTIQVNITYKIVP